MRGVTSYCQLKYKEFVIVSLVLGDAIHTCLLFGTTRPHRFIFSLYEVMSSEMMETTIWSNVNEIVNGRQMLVLSCYCGLSLRQP